MNGRIIELVISIIGTLSSIISLILSLRMMSIKNSVLDSDKMKLRWWPIVIILLMTAVSFCLSVIWFVSLGKYLGWGVFVTFIVSLISLSIYAFKANKSLDEYNNLPPKSLWQVLFNKIPSHIEYANQVVFKFLVLKMEDSKEVNEAGQKIEDNYSGRKDFQVEVKSYKDKQIVTSDYCGIIFIVGKDSYQRQNEVLKIIDEYAKQLALPIAYICVGDDYYRLRKYHRISYHYLDNCANHLIMRGYRRSEHWIRLSRLSHAALWSTIIITLLLLMSSVMLGRIVIEKQYVIKQKEQKIIHNGIQIRDLKDSLIIFNMRNEKQIKCLKDSLMIFGANRRLIRLDNSPQIKSIKNVNIEALQKNQLFKNFVDGFAKYCFGEVRPKKILLWLRNDRKKPLVCVYDSEDNPAYNNYKDENSMIGGIANHKRIFVLWPGYSNKDSIWRNPNKNSMAWFNDDNGKFAVSKLMKDNKGLLLQQNAGSDEFSLCWLVNEQNDHKEDDIALYGFSYDGYLAIELDFECGRLNSDENLRVYIQNLVFRNTVRKFTVCITSFLNSCAAHTESVKK